MSEDVGQPGAVETLRRRRDFLKAQAGAKSVRPGFIVRARQRPAGEADPRAARTGLTVSRKTGGAVQRNRIKRRLRHAFRRLRPDTLRPGYDYVVIARAKALAMPFDQLTRDLESAIVSLHRHRKSPRQPKMMSSR